MEKEKSIETPELLIKGNIMRWDGTMIQLANISCISTTALDQIEFPKLSILLLAVGLLFFKLNALVGLILLASGAVLVYQWYNTNEKRKTECVLNITMNSGNNLRFLIKDMGFLQNILNVLEQIILKGGIGNQSIVINIKDSTIGGNTNILNDSYFR